MTLQRGTYVTRGRFQEEVAKNRRLIHDIFLLTSPKHVGTKEWEDVVEKWCRKWEAEEEFIAIMKEIANEYKPEIIKNDESN